MKTDPRILRIRKLEREIALAKCLCPVTETARKTIVDFISEMKALLAKLKNDPT